MLSCDLHGQELSLCSTLPEAQRSAALTQHCTLVRVLGAQCRKCTDPRGCQPHRAVSSFTYLACHVLFLEASLLAPGRGLRCEPIPALQEHTMGQVMTLANRCLE